MRQRQWLLVHTSDNLDEASNRQKGRKASSISQKIMKTSLLGEMKLE